MTTLEEVNAVLNGWDTFPPTKRLQVFDEFLKVVSDALAMKAYDEKVNAENHLKIAEGFRSKLNEHKTYAELKVEYHGALQNLYKIELYMRDILTSAKDIPEDHKKWMENYCKREERKIEKSISYEKGMIEDFSNSVQNMGGKVEKQKELKRAEVVQQHGSKAFKKEKYKLIKDEREKYMLLQRKREQYMMWDQEIHNLAFKMEKSLEPSNLYGPEFPFFKYKDFAERIVRQLKGVVEQFGAC